MRVAFLNSGGVGMDASGTSRWMQTMAGGLAGKGYEVDYYYSLPCANRGSPYKLPPMDSSRLDWMQGRAIQLVEYRLQALDGRRITNNWIKTDFWSLFDASKYDLVQVAKAGPMEFPFYHLKAPVVEFLSLGTGVDPSPNIVWSIHCSEWQRQAWLMRGGKSNRSSVISNPVFPIVSTANFRERLGIPPSALVAGFHQRSDEHIVSPIPLQAFANHWSPERHFVLMGGGVGYRKQAIELGLKNIHFLPQNGDIEVISQFLNTLDIYTHGRADGETFGTVLAEALMHGRPCLTHFVDGNNNAQAETIGPGGVCVRDLAEYSDWFGKLFASAELRKHYGALATPFARQFYSEETAVTKLSSLYHALIERQSMLPFVISLGKNHGQPSEKTPSFNFKLPKHKFLEVFKRLLIALSHPRLASRNAMRKVYHTWVGKIMRHKLRKHPYFSRD